MNFLQGITARKLDVDRRTLVGGERRTFGRLVKVSALAFVGVGSCPRTLRVRDARATPARRGAEVVAMRAKPLRRTPTVTRSDLTTRHQATHPQTH